MSVLRKTVRLGENEFLLQTLTLWQMREYMRDMAKLNAMPDGDEKEDAMIARFTKSILLSMNNVEGLPSTSAEGLESMLNCDRNGVEALNAFYSLHGEVMAVSGMKTEGAKEGEAAAAPETSTSTNSAVA